MKRLISGAFLFILVLGMLGCSKNAEVTVAKTFEQTPSELVETNIKENKEVIMETYYEMSDGTWKTGDYAYQYRLVITGRLSNAVRDTTYTILSNTDDITFEQAWKASGLSSNLDDYFQPEDAVFVAVQ